MAFGAGEEELRAARVKILLSSSSDIGFGAARVSDLADGWAVVEVMAEEEERARRRCRKWCIIVVASSLRWLCGRCLSEVQTGQVGRY